MNRRTLLSAMATGVGALAGCSALGAGPETEPEANESTPSVTPDDEIEPRYAEPTRDSDAVFETPERTDARLEVGEGGEDIDSHGVTVENAADEPRDLELRVADRTDGSIPIEQPYEVSARGGVSIALLEPSNYLLDVGVPATETGASIEIGPGNFDCNASTTHVEVAAHGRISASTISTAMACSDAPSER